VNHGGSHFPIPGGLSPIETMHSSICGYLLGRYFVTKSIFQRLAAVFCRLINTMSTAASVLPHFGLGSATAADEQIRQESLAVAQGLKRQDAGLLDELIVRYQHRLLRYLLYLTSNREMAEDLFQEVWMRVLVRGAQFNGQARFDTWLFTIARNLVIDYRRKRTMSSLDELFEGKSDDDRPMSFEVADSWIRFIARCWCCASTRSCLWKRLPRLHGRHYPLLSQGFTGAFRPSRSSWSGTACACWRRCEEYLRCVRRRAE